MNHGTTSGYQRGCRCARCRERWCVSRQETLERRAQACSVCGAKIHAYSRTGLCRSHAMKRAHRGSSPQRFAKLHAARASMAQRPLVERFLDKIEIHESCWLWTGAKKSTGYGHLSVGQRGKGHVLAHRFSWEWFNERRIPDGLHIDHLCCNPLCVNPNHLEPVTLGENNRRQSERKKAA